ncbi:MAG: zinc ABC transporter substrate-binding protein [Burkholderiales bacterium]|jgi:zinc transport system substrate-binding protein|nr:zinc ABC transporter substrate-binding protein [Burkholderiales bacterium]
MKKTGIGSMLCRGVITTAMMGVTLMATAAPNVVVTIAPIHSLVKEVMSGVGTPKLLLEGSASPHDYAPRPSDVAAIARADAVFWIDESLEGFMPKLLATNPKASVPLLSSATVKLNTREGGIWEEHDHNPRHEHEHKHEHEHEHEHEGDHHGDHESDPHVWLDPANAEAMTQTIAATLARMDPHNAGRYEQNANAVREKLSALDQEIKTLLAQVNDRPFIVFHDAYQYFERRYQLKAAGSITVSPEQKPSAKRLSSLRARIQRDHIVCVFTEPQFNEKSALPIIENTNARIAVLDPLGTSNYIETLRALALSFRGCLSPAQ